MLAAPLYEMTDLLLADETKLDAAKRSFELLKTKLMDAPLLRHLDRKKPIHVLIYVNDWAFGTAVMQEWDGQFFQYDSSAKFSPTRKQATQAQRKRY